MRHPELNYSSPRVFTLRQKLLLAVAPRAAALVMGALMRTCHLETVGDGPWRTAVAQGPTIVTSWHENLALSFHFFRGAGHHTLTSQSFDGELAARTAAAFGFEASRGSTSRGGADAIRQLSKAVGLGESVGLTVDGPRGPRRKAKPGAAIIAERTGAPLFPVVLAAHPVWRLGSWDRTQIPKPFARIVVLFGEPLQPPEAGVPDRLRRMTEELDRRLNALQPRAEAMAQGD